MRWLDCGHVIGVLHMVGAYDRLSCCPADDDNDAVLFEKIKSGNYDADDPIWENISDEAKDVVAKLLTVRPHPDADFVLVQSALQEPLPNEHEPAYSVCAPDGPAATDGDVAQRLVDRHPYDALLMGSAAAAAGADSMCAPVVVFVARALFVCAG